jgi:hypothetical protein
MLLTIAQNNLYEGNIKSFFEAGGSSAAWENLLTDGNKTQITRMLDNVLWLQEQGWSLPSNVDFGWFWNHVLKDIIGSNYDLSDRFDEAWD